MVGEVSEEPRDYLAPTRAINFRQPDIQALAKKIVEGCGTDVAKAVAIHDWVRDNIPFGFCSKFASMTATEVLRGGKGFCNTKSTLFVALLRVHGIPARIRYYEISADILRGLGIPGSYVEHAVSEVWLEGKWVRTDSYIVDPALWRSVTARLAEEHQLLGYGVNVLGSNTWDGQTDSFSQYHLDARIPQLARREYGVHADIFDLYQRGPKLNVSPWFMWLAFPLFCGGINQSIASARNYTSSLG